jgi:two-component system sensor histidine kinase PilS (NtrC family)
LTADLEQLKQSLWDLAINAAEAMQGRGTLLFQVVVDEVITIIVEDSGPGISADVKARIFEPFFSTKEKGTGLGLASVYVAMEAHNGQLTVTDGIREGACFRLSFPQVESDE